MFQRARQIFIARCAFDTNFMTFSAWYQASTCSSVTVRGARSPKIGAIWLQPRSQSSRVRYALSVFHVSVVRKRSKAAPSEPQGQTCFCAGSRPVLATCQRAFHSCAILQASGPSGPQGTDDGKPMACMRLVESQKPRPPFRTL